MVWGRRGIGRPPRWVRIVFLLVALFSASGLVAGSPRPIDVVRTVLMCGIWVFIAISPRAIYDGRVSAWERAHPVQVAALLFVFLGLLMFNGLTYFLSPPTSALISAGFSAAFTLWAVWRGRNRSDPHPAE